ncbi:hypothetical protein DCO58_01265 [Helicobacter saguini]|uniref:Uncharacterized protein n=1 Tax=Helicobacter saguini TaxID=1548018 RepID=A0A347VR93_9HELI|nr:hypothetical protein [Helicobacter saguini]MWV62986.1 hypothetical protein [Helicobacter saguini]MWV66345.1 hypothetical protein [Helicobacter saguini]MWV68697.1 hypothetical protein [Helicobacter saguini]MWV71752.1 hypothetical protein [Helicobacter saguini]TLD91617.1 hypothetical protein LS64_011725 [Helicobacter saguini]
MISICVLFFSVILYFVDRILCFLKLDSKKILIFKYCLVLILFLFALFAPFYEGFSLVVLCYSLFDSTSVFCTLLLIYLCFKIMYKDFIESNLQNSHSHFLSKSIPTLPPFCKINTKNANANFANAQDFIESNSLQTYVLCITLALLGFILYAHTLNLTNIDIYHKSPIIHAFIALITIITLYKINKTYATLALTALISSIFTKQDFSILEFLICPYLWIFSLFYITITPFLNLIKILQKS